MKKLKDVTLTLKGVDGMAINHLYDLAGEYSNEFHLSVTDPGYDLVPETEGDTQPYYPRKELT